MIDQFTNNSIDGVIKFQNSKNDTDKVFISPKNNSSSVLSDISFLNSDNNDSLNRADTLKDVIVSNILPISSEMDEIYNSKVKPCFYIPKESDITIINGYYELTGNNVSSVIKQISNIIIGVSTIFEDTQTSLDDDLSIRIVLGRTKPLIGTKISDYTNIINEATITGSFKDFNATKYVSINLPAYDHDNIYLMILLTNKFNSDLNFCVNHIKGYNEKIHNNLKYTGSIIVNPVDGANYGKYSSSTGWNTKAIGEYSHAEGESTTTNGNNSHAEGSNTTADGNNSHAEGYSTTSTGHGSHAEGFSTNAIGNYSHVEGRNNTIEISGIASHAEGVSTTASGEGSHTEGYKTQATAVYSHAEGSGRIGIKETEESIEYADKQVVAEGEGSHAEGCNTKASGIGSHAEGSGRVKIEETEEYVKYDNKPVTASGEGSHAEGCGTSASGIGSHAEGCDTYAGGSYSHAAGSHTRARHPYQYVIGSYNNDDVNAMFIVGNGSGDGDSRNNAFTVNTDGTATVGKDPVSDMDVATKKYVDYPDIEKIEPGAGTDITIENVDPDVSYNPSFPYPCFKIRCGICFVSFSFTKKSGSDQFNEGDIILTGLPKLVGRHSCIETPIYSQYGPTVGTAIISTETDPYLYVGNVNPSVSRYSGKISFSYPCIPPTTD